MVVVVVEASSSGTKNIIGSRETLTSLQEPPNPGVVTLSAIGTSMVAAWAYSSHQLWPYGESLQWERGLVLTKFVSFFPCDLVLIVNNLNLARTLEILKIIV